MKTYALLLDILILLFIMLAIHFNVNDDYIIDDVSGRKGALHVMIISWQTFFCCSRFLFISPVYCQEGSVKKLQAGVSILKTLPCQQYSNKISTRKAHATHRIEHTY